MDPPPKRQRVSTACDRCRKLKVKCSGRVPCSRCERLGIKCSYAPEFLPDKVVPANSEEKLLSVEHSHPVRPLQGNKTFESRCNFLGSVSQWRVFARSQLLLLRDLCTSNYQQIPNLSASELRLPRMQNYGWNKSGVQYLEKPSLPDRPEYDFSPVSGELLDHFFKEINPLFGILSTKFHSFFELNYTNFMKASSHTSLKSKSDIHLHSALLYFVFAISIRFTEFSRPEGPRKEWLQLESKCFEYAYRVVEILSFEFFSLELIQGWLLVTLYLRITNNQRSMMRALDLVNCMARTMGLQESRVAKTKAESTRRKATHLFWTVFTFDQLFSIQLGRRSFWREEEISVPFPDETDPLWKDNESSSEQLAMFKLALLAHDVQRTKWADIDEATVTGCAGRIEATYRWLRECGMMNLLSPSKCREQIMLHFYDIAFAFQGPFLFNYLGKSYPFQGLDIEIILDYMEDVMNLTQTSIDQKRDRSPWYNSLTLVFIVGTYSLILVNGGVLGHKPRKLLGQALETLNHFASYTTADGDTLFPKATECVWALSQGIKSVQFRFEQDAKLILTMDMGDHSAYVNEPNFGLMGKYTEYANDELPQLDEYNTKSEPEDVPEFNENMNVDEMIRQLNSGSWIDFMGGDLLEPSFRDLLDNSGKRGELNTEI